MRFLAHCGIFDIFVSKTFSISKNEYVVRYFLFLSTIYDKLPADYQNAYTNYFSEKIEI